MLPTREDDPEAWWYSRISVTSAETYRYNLKLFLEWLQQNGHKMTSKELIEKQKHAISDEQYEILDWLQTWVNGLNRTTAGKRIAYASVKSFFMHNRAPLPRDKFHIISDKRVTQGKLQTSDVIRIAQTANPRDRSLILVKWQSLQDSARLIWISKNSAEEIVTQMKAGACPIKISIPSRKQNEKNYYCYIGRDAIDALREYFDKVRGWPKKGEAIWMNNQGRPLEIDGFRAMWTSMCRRAGLIQKEHGQKDSRFGFNSHEMRDLAKTILHLNALNDGFDMDTCEYWLGHTVDKLGYDKFSNDEEYMRKQYQIAEKYLNIISLPTIPIIVKDQSARITELENLIRAVMPQLLEMKAKEPYSK